MYVVKLAVALVLAGGVERRDASGTKVRGRSCLHGCCEGAACTVKGRMAEADSFLLGPWTIVQPTLRSQHCLKLCGVRETNPDRTFVTVAVSLL